MGAEHPQADGLSAMRIVPPPPPPLDSATIRKRAHTHPNEGVPRNSACQRVGVSDRGPRLTLQGNRREAASFPPALAAEGKKNLRCGQRCLLSRICWCRRLLGGEANEINAQYRR